MLLVPLSLVSVALAYNSGITGYSTTGCTSCHGASASSATTVSFSHDAEVEPGDTISVTFRVAHATQSAAGLNVSASSGTLTAGSNTRVSSSQITHSSRRTMSAGAVDFAMSWTAPSTEGTVTLYGAGNAVNGNGGSSGDAWNRTSTTITVSDGCDDTDGDGEGDRCGEDCDESDGTVYLGAPETCDGVDDDCDGTIDESAVDAVTLYRDSDGDGYGDASVSQRACSAVGYVTNALDCDDTDAAVSPDGVETCDRADQDCDGSVDEDATDASTWFADTDLDGFGDDDVTVRACSASGGAASVGGDCDDTRFEVNPDAVEVCDARDADEDCDGAADDADASVTGLTSWYSDADNDGYGDAWSVDACEQPTGTVAVSGDCDDTSTAFNPGAVEVCTDPTDYNCDGSVGYADDDADGWAACAECDDTDDAISPDAIEACDGVDNNCDGTVDEATATGTSTFYADTDNDGFGDAAVTTVACSAPDGYVADGTDCSDADATVYPGAAETWYDGVDQSCDGNDDDQDGDGYARDADCLDTDARAYPGAEDAWYDGLDADCRGNSDFDADADGHDSATWGGDDCDDARADTYPDAPDEPYDGVVTDCDDADEFDQDGDGATVDVDCDDANSAVRPGAQETWYDGVDQDCDGNDTDQDEDGVAAADDCDDTDPAVQACDTGDTGDTGTTDTDTDTETPKDDDEAAGCGCASTSGGAALGWGLAALLTSWRIGRSRASRPARG